MVAIALYPILLPQYFGVIPIFALWVAISVVLTSAGTRFYDRFGIPLVTLVIVAGLGFQFAGWNDNHRFRHSQQTVQRASLDGAFADWIGSRKDAAAYAGREYPVYIVTAEGGGIYAAQHAARVLSRIQDLMPKLRTAYICRKHRFRRQPRHGRLHGPGAKAGAQRRGAAVARKAMNRASGLGADARASRRTTSCRRSHGQRSFPISCSASCHFPSTPSIAPSP